MSKHPLNLALRFLLEILALVILGVWGWRQGDGGARFLIALGLPLVAAVLWGTFNVPQDPSRSGKAPVPVPGALRLLLELSLFAAATWMLLDIGWSTWAAAFGVVVTVHYLLSLDRIGWLLRSR